MQPGTQPDQVRSYHINVNNQQHDLGFTLYDRTETSDARLIIEVKNTHTFRTWKNTFTATGLEALTRKSGSLKKFACFYHMLIDAAQNKVGREAKSAQVSLDVMDYSKLLLLLKKVPTNVNAATKTNENNLYVILTYQSDYDKITYPLTLHSHVPTQEEMIDIIKRLSVENTRWRAKELQYQQTTEQMNHQIHDLKDKFAMQEQEINQLQEMTTNADPSEMVATKAYFKQRLKAMEVKLVEKDRRIDHLADKCKKLKKKLEKTKQKPSTTTKSRRKSYIYESDSDRPISRTGAKRRSSLSKSRLTPRSARKKLRKTPSPRLGRRRTPSPVHRIRKTPSPRNISRRSRRSPSPRRGSISKKRKTPSPRLYRSPSPRRKTPSPRRKRRTPSPQRVLRSTPYRKPPSPRFDPTAWVEKRQKRRASTKKRRSLSRMKELSSGSSRFSPRASSKKKKSIHLPPASKPPRRRRSNIESDSDIEYIETSDTDVVYVHPPRRRRRAIEEVDELFIDDDEDDFH